MLYPLVTKLVIGGLCLPVFIIGVMGNAIVILLVLKQDSMKTPTNIFIVQLAISDLILLFFCMPFTVTSVYITEDWIFGVSMCKTVMFMQVFAVLLSILTLTAMSVERYFKLVHPLRTTAQWSNDCALKMCLLIVFVAAGLSLPRPILGGMLHLKEGMSWDPRIARHNKHISTMALLNSELMSSGPNNTIHHMLDGAGEGLDGVSSSGSGSRLGSGVVSDFEQSSSSGNGTGTPYTPVPFLFCFEDLGPHPTRYYFISAYNGIRIALFYLVPLVINAAIYRTICATLSKSRDMNSGNLEERVRMRKKRQSERLLRMLRWMLVLFAVCWGPYQAFLVIQALDDRELFRQEWFQKGMVVVSVFMYMHCISSPILYYNMNTQFRNGITYYLCGWRKNPNPFEKHGQATFSSSFPTGHSNTNTQHTQHTQLHTAHTAQAEAQQCTEQPRKEPESAESSIRKSNKFRDEQQCSSVNCAHGENRLTAL